MEYSEAYFNGRDGSPRFFRTWSPNSTPKGTVVISHGYAEHSGRYREFGERLVEAGFAVWAYDHYGHGHSEGPRALIERIELLAEDLAIAIETAAALHDTAPVFLYGHSMGGAIAALTASQRGYPLSGIIFSGAAVRIVSTKPAILRGAARIIRLFSPSLPILPFDIDGISQSEQVRDAYRNDSLNYTGKLKVSTALEMAEAEKMLDKRAMSSIRVPVLVLHGSEDRLVPPESSQVLYDNLGSEDKTLRYFEGAFHEIHNEECAEEVYSLITRWLHSHVG